ncbi:MAG: sulfotransferase [Flavobacteriales bacterium]|nr:sulfotransferase [Flavobacteriales bacterium]
MVNPYAEDRTAQQVRSMSEFKIPPISTLAGSSFVGYFRILRHGKVAERSYLKVLLTTLVVLIRAPFQLWENLVFGIKISRASPFAQPLFILGHWRSGTTLLHNVLCQDPRASYLTTYASVFPNNMASTWIFKTFLKMNMPEKRPSDGVALHTDFPQEDEFAFGNMQPNAYYNFFYFPSRYQQYYDRAVHHAGMDEREIDRWYRTYDKLLKKAAVASSGERMIVKNPVNTARIGKLLQLYPDAKFIYIQRNPIEVFLSTRRFFQQLMPTLCLEEPPTKSFMDDMILNVYDRMMHDYEEQRSLIPAKNLLEIRYEVFAEAPLVTLEAIERNLLDRDPAPALSNYSAYLNTQKSHRTNTYDVEEADLQHVLKCLRPHMSRSGYALPESIKAVTSTQGRSEPPN